VLRNKEERITVSKTKFPKRIYTVDEYMAAREALAAGYKHRLRIDGSSEFKQKVRVILDLIKKAKYYVFLRTYIRRICEMEGISQLREAEATIWLNHNVIKNPFAGARFIIQKAEQMKSYLEGKIYYISGELSAVQKSIEFLTKLCDSLDNEELKAQCDKLLQEWTEDQVL
jgi:hypothetical protein